MQGLPFLLPDGKVMLVGGSDAAVAGASTDIYDPVTGIWAFGPPPASTHPQLAAGARLLDGRILITGGRHDSGITIASADIYSPATHTWTAARGMNRSRLGHTLTLLADGRVLAAGGYSSESGFDSTAEIYNPASDTWSFTAAMSNGRWLHSATRLTDGRVMVVGGEHYTDPQGPHFRLTQVYNPATATWTAGPLMTAGRASHGAALLPDGRLMVMGGISGWATPYLASSEIFNGTSWQAGPSMAEGRLHFPAVVLGDGSVLVSGGTSLNTTPQTVTAGTERFDPATNAWTSSGVMNTVRRFHSVIELADGRVLVAGGQDGSVAIGSSEIMGGDWMAPHTTAVRSVAPNGNGWNNGNVTVTLESADTGGSGLQSLVYSLTGAQGGGASITGATAAIVISAEGTTTLAFHATDVEGNIEPEQTLVVRIDKTSPVLANQPNLAVAATAGGTVVNFSTSATDGPSGISSVTSVPLSSGMRFPAGTTTVQRTALDAAGNSAMSSFTVTVVPSAPVITVTGGAFVADGSAHPATAIARDSTGAVVAGTFNLSYAPGNASAPSTPGHFSASAEFVSADPGITNAAPWTAWAPDPHQKFNPGVAEIGGKVYVLGFDQGSFIPRLSILDPATNTWTTGAPPGLIRAFASVGVIDGKLYAVGGCIHSDCSNITNALEIYDPAANAWSAGAPMLTRRLGAAAGVIDGRLIVAGGTLACPPCVPTSATEVYDPASNSWTARSPIPVSRELATGTVVNGLLYVVGGYWRDPLTLLGGPSTRVDVYDPVADSWSQRSSMPTPRSAAAAGVVNGEIHVVGGMGATPLAVVEIYNVQTDTWVGGPAMPTARFYAGSAAVNSKLYVIGGITAAGLIGPSEAFDPSLTARIVISPPNLAPVAHAGGPYLADLGSPLSLSGAGSSDPDAADSIAHYSWLVGGTLSLSGVSPVVSPSQLAALGAGPHSVLLTVTDTFGATGSASTTLSVYNNVVTAAFTSGPNPAACGQLITFNGSGSGAGRPDRAIVNYVWNFGDGTPVASGIATIVSHAYAAFGAYTATLTVTDNNVPARSAATSVQVNVNQGNFAPVANAGGPYTVASGGAVALNGTSSSDSNAVCGDSIVSYVWTIDGSIQLSGPNPILNTSLTPLTAGNHTVSLRVTDTFGAIGTTSTTINVQRQLVSISVAPADVTLSPGQTQAFQATGHYSDGTTQMLPSGNSGGGGGSNPPIWEIEFIAALDVSVCATAQSPAPIHYSVQNFLDRQGSIVETWSVNTPVMSVQGAIDSAAVSLTMTCNNGPATGVVNAHWTGTRYEGTFTFNGGASAGAVSITGWSSKAAMPVARFSHVAATVGGMVYTMGGVSPGGWSPAIDRYNPVLDSWTTVGQMVTSREGAGAVTVNGKIYVVGGNVAGSIASNLVEAYDPATNSWATGLAPMPTPRAHLAVVTDGAFLYALGGDNAPNNGGMVSTVERYDPSGNSWSTLAAMPSPGSFMAAGFLGGNIIVTGSGGNNSSATDVYNVTSNTWRTGPPMPAGRALAAAGIANGGLYLVGGTANGQPARGAWVYYPASPGRAEVWSYASEMRLARSQAAAAVVGDVIYLVGGMDSNSNPTVIMAVNEALSTPPVNTFAPAQPGVQWQSLNASVAGIDPGGNAHANTVGATTIVATAGGITCTTSNTCTTLIVADTQAPNLALPNNQTRQATGPSGAVVTYFASANDAVDGQRPVTCQPASGATFALGTTTVTCSASDMSGNSASGTFTIKVEDTNAPFMSAPTGTQTRQASSPAGVLATFSVTANDSVDGPRPVTCTPPSGSQFPFGSTAVTCTASDTRGNTATRSFTILVQDTNAPFLNVPFQPLEVPATAAVGAIVVFGQAVSASDSVDGSITPVCTPASGSQFPIGTTSVSCKAIDAHGNQSPTKTFAVKVTDEAVVSVPANIIAEATSAAGAAVPFVASASTLLGGNAPVQCFVVTAVIDGDVQLGGPVASGDLFAMGTTTVGCLAGDGGEMFTVTVADTLAPVVTVVTPRADDLIPTSPSSIVVDVEVFEAVAVTAVKINGVDAMAIGATPAGSLWRTQLSATAGVALTIAATATDGAGHLGATTVVIDNDGIAGLIDRARISGADQRAVYSSEFGDGTTAGTISRLSGATVTAAQHGTAIAVGLASQGNAQVSACSGTLKYVLLNTPGESADVSGAGTGTITVTAHTPDTIDVYKSMPEDAAFAQMRCLFLPLAYRYSGVCSASPTPVSYYYSYRVGLGDGQTVSTGSPVTASSDNLGTIEVTLLQVDDQGNEVPVGSFELDPGESADVSVTHGANREDQILFSVLRGTITVTVGGVAQTVNEGGQATLVTDLTAPTVAISSSTPEPTGSSPIAVNLVFSEPVVDFDPATLVVTNAAVSGFWGTGALYTFNLVPLAPGAVTVALPSNAVSDAAGMGNVASAVFVRTFVSTPPVVTTSGDVTVEAVAADGAVVRYSASAVDAANLPTAVTCSVPSGSLFPIGATLVTCSSADANGNTGTATLTVTVRDTTAPSIHSAVPGPELLWPPNHQMVPITIAVGVTDAVTTAPVCKVDGVTSNEDVNGPGDGDTAPDWSLAGGLSISLRAERAGGGVGRVYTVTISCSDGAGNQSTTTTRVTVASSLGKLK